MITLLREFEARLKPILPVFLFDATGATSPAYFVLSIGTGRPDVDGETLAGDRSPVDELVRLTTTGGTGHGVLANARAAHDALTPNGRPRRVAVDGWRGQLAFLRNEVPVQPDRDNTLPGSNRHPLFTVDSFQLLAVPV